MAGRVLLCSLALLPVAAVADRIDPRLRDVLYSADEIYRLPAYVGYAIDVQFASDERFVGVGTGDAAALTLAARANHLFIKPRASSVHTNLTVLTTRHVYHFDYDTVAGTPDVEHADVLYALRFLYPEAPPPLLRPLPVQPADGTAQLLAWPAAVRNADYWYCGSPSLRPLAAWDDGVQTHLRFPAQVELPAPFVLGDDGSEGLVDFHAQGSELVLHRTARRFVLRRGRLAGCIVNRGFAGSGSWLPSGTLSPQVQRTVLPPPGRRP